MEQEPKTPRERAEDLISQLVPDWRPTTQQVLWTVRIVVALVALYVLIRFGYVLQWTGFGQTEVKGGVQPSKTPWDWMDLLIITVVLAVGGYLFRPRPRSVTHFCTCAGGRILSGKYKCARLRVVTCKSLRGG